jgi:hypothetical protein
MGRSPAVWYSYPAERSFAAGPCSGLPDETSPALASSAKQVKLPQMARQGTGPTRPASNSYGFALTLVNKM